MYMYMYMYIYIYICIERERSWRGLETRRAGREDESSASTGRPGGTDRYVYMLL